jgi:TDG/mug DNA glycosylase family protein
MRGEGAADRLPDILGKDLAVVFGGINPALSAAEAGHHFVAGSNRFWRVIHLNDRTILRYGCGLTAVVERPTARADELSAEDFNWLPSWRPASHEWE